MKEWYKNLGNVRFSQTTILFYLTSFRTGICLFLIKQNRELADHFSEEKNLDVIKFLQTRNENCIMIN